MRGIRLRVSVAVLLSHKSLISHQSSIISHQSWVIQSPIVGYSVNWIGPEKYVNRPRVRCSQDSWWSHFWLKISFVFMLSWTWFFGVLDPFLGDFSAPIWAQKPPNMGSKSHSCNYLLLIPANFIFCHPSNENRPFLWFRGMLGRANFTWKLKSGNKIFSKCVSRSILANTDPT